MPEVRTRTEGNIFSLYVERLNTVYGTFERRLSDHIKARQALGLSREQVLSELRDDLDGQQSVFNSLVSDAIHETDFGLNTSYQVASNENIAERVIWTLDPEAEHCDSCMHQAGLGPRSYDEVPFPGSQPTVGETNCERYCKCTLEPVKS